MTMKRNDDAVSPVIGVILMVAITVILAAIIAAFVFGMVGGTASTKVVGVTVALSGTDEATVTWQGGADIDKIQYWNVTNPTNVTNNGTAPKVGQINTLSPVTSGDRVVITATFDDGSTQVVYDRQF